MTHEMLLLYGYHKTPMSPTILMGPEYSKSGLTCEGPHRIRGLPSLSNTCCFIVDSSPVYTGLHRVRLELTPLPGSGKGHLEVPSDLVHRRYLT